jgi:hypothetical protein
MEQLIAQIVFLHQVAECADSRLVRSSLPAKINTNELPGRATDLQRAQDMGVTLECLRYSRRLAGEAIERV